MTRLESPLALAKLLIFSVVLAYCGKSSHASELRFTPMVRAVAGARPSVVNIHGRKTVQADSDRFSSKSREVNGMGTGVVIDPRGYIITNYHVIEGVANIRVTMADRATHAARLIAHDPKTDLAIIKLDLDVSLPVLKIGTSSDLMTAEPVIAVGNAYGYEHTVTQGIISELHRTVQVSDEQTYQDLIQTDASINPGNSGGPLLNIDGEMVGLNVAVRVGAQGIGFAIPVDDVMETASRLLSSERVGNIMHGIVGETQVTDRVPRFVVTSLRNDSPAVQAGLQKGDVITAVGDEEIGWGLDFERQMLARQAGETIELTVERGMELHTLELSLASATSAASKPELTDWTALGLKLESVSASVLKRINSPYRGGMRVVDVRGNGLAGEAGIQRGDILVGLLGWETISQENINYIVRSKEFQSGQSMKFYLIRGGETLWGHLKRR